MWIVDTPSDVVSERKFQRFSASIVDAPSDVAFKRKLRRDIAWIVAAMPDLASERKLRSFSAWIVDAIPDIAFEWTCFVEKILLSLFDILTEVTNLHYVDSRHSAECRVPT